MKDILFLLIVIPVIASFIIVMWMILWGLILIIVENYQDWRRKR